MTIPMRVWTIVHEAGKRLHFKNNFFKKRKKKRKEKKRKIWCGSNHKSQIVETQNGNLIW
jgi:hypothetical protein